jgi:hypothetical protein
MIQVNIAGFQGEYLSVGSELYTRHLSDDTRFHAFMTSEKTAAADSCQPKCLRTLAECVII